MSALKTTPVTLKDANAFVASFHRHHRPTVGHKFSVGCSVDNKLVGVAICGRPVSRHVDDGETLEVNRLCTDGTKNACSRLYAACARIAKEMGFKKIVTYTLPSEGGASLKASGWRCAGQNKGGSWDSPTRRRTDKAPTEPKWKWEKQLHE